MSAATRRTVWVLALVVACVVLGAPAAAFATITLTPQGGKLTVTGSGEITPGDFGWSVALSSDGNTALVGGFTDNNYIGAAWVFARSGGVWTEQAVLRPSDEINTSGGNGEFGYSVALSADGKTALIGGPGDNTTSGSGVGAAWVYTYSGTSWSEQTKLLGSGENGAGLFGESVALSADGSTALIGGSEDGGLQSTYGDGAAWLFTDSSGTWDAGTKLVGDCLNACTGANGSGEIGSGRFGNSVAISGDGSTGLIGADADNGSSGAAWLFSLGASPAQLTEMQAGTCTITGCTQVTGESGLTSSFGSSTALSNDGTTALIGGQSNNSFAGAAWVFTSPGSTGPWSQQAELTGAGESSGGGLFGQSAGLSSDGDTALIGGSQDQGAGTMSGDGAAWAFTRSGTAWSQQGAKLLGDCATNCAANGTGEIGAGEFGNGVAVSAGGSTLLVGGPTDNSSDGAAWPFTVALPTATTTALTPSQNPTQVGVSVTFTATVSPTPDGGTVSFTSNGTALCSNVTVASGVATCQTSFSAGASYSIVATYNGDPAYSTSTSNTVTEVVTGGQTSITLQSSKNPAATGDMVTYAATVTPTPDGGTVRFDGGSGAIPGCETVAVVAGTATCKTVYSAVGTYQIVAIYSGDASFDASDTNSLDEQIEPGSPTVAISASVNPSHGGAVTYTATVTPNPGGGQIGFTQDSVYTLLCPQMAASASGAATCTTSYSATGSHTIYAFFTGDANYTRASGQLNESVTPGGNFTNSSVAISLAQEAGDPAQTGPSGSSLHYAGVPLVTGRATVARVFADPTGLGLAGTSGLQATLYGSVNGQPLPGSPLTEDGGGPRALGDLPFAAQLGLPDTSFNFPLPASWTHGDITLHAVVAPAALPPAGTTAACTGPCTASLTITTVHFHDVPIFEVTPVELTWTNNKTGALEAPGNPQAAMATAYGLMPVQKIVNEGYQGTIDETSLQSDKGGLGGNQANGDALNLVIQWADTQFLNSTGSSTGNLHDMVVGFNVDIARGDTEYDPTLGVFTLGSKAWNVEEPVAVVDAGYGLATAHELGHGVGRRHADESCGGPAGGGSDPNWPDYNGVLEPTSTYANGHTGTWSTITSAPVASYGINPHWRVTSASGPGPLTIFPDSDFDYMSYCAKGNTYTTPTETSPGTVWTSARGWQEEYRCMSNEANPPAGCPVNEQQPSAGKIPVPGGAAAVASANAGRTAGGAAVNGPVISFRGYLEPGGSLLSPALMPAVGGVTGPAGSAFTATLVNRRGKVIATAPLDSQSMHFDAYPGHPAVPLLALQGSIPTHGQPVAGLIVRASGHVQAKITAPRQAPRVTVATPRLNRRTRSLTVRWNSHDASTARRTVFIAVSTTGRRYTTGRRSTTGRRYRTVWEGFDQGHAAIPLTELPRAGWIRLRVFVTDGFGSSLATTRPIRLRARVRIARAAAPPAWLIGLQRDGIDVVAP